MARFPRLVEYDSALHEFAAMPLKLYLGKSSPAANHCIVGLAFLQDISRDDVRHFYVGGWVASSDESSSQ